MTLGLDALHFLRPDWLWMLLGLPLLAWWWRRRQRHTNVWREAVDPHLLAHLLGDRPGSRRSRLAIPAGLAFLLGGLLAYLLVVLALAGPSWRQTEQPLWQPQTPLVIALDLSSATLAGDLQPSRLAQARAKLAVLLDERKGGQVGLVAYAGAAFTVAPLTRDVANVALFLDALHPDVMPVDGQRADQAIDRSVRLLEQAGFQNGRILVLTNRADADALAAARTASSRGFSVSVIGLGEPQGAAYKTPAGTIASSRLEADSLRQLVVAGGGQYVTMTRDNADLDALGVLDPTDAGIGGSADEHATAEHGLSWQDDGFWLLPPLMLLVLLAFRRGAPVVMVVLCLWLPGRAVHAAELWQRPDQLSHQQMELAAQAYRQEDFARAAELYGTIDGAQADYNRGNALAKAGHYPQALEAYDEAIAGQPEMADAIANRQAVEAAMKRQPPEGQGDDKQSESGQNGSGQGGSGQKSPDQSGSEPPDAQQGDSEQAGSEQAGSEQADPKQDQSDSAQQKDPGAQPQDESESGAPPENSPPEASDADAQQAADDAQRERMEQALGQAGEETDKQGEPAAPATSSETPEQRERRIANEAWLGRIPDDPGGLLRAKFRIEYQRRELQGGSEQ